MQKEKRKSKEKGKPSRYSPTQIGLMIALSVAIIYFIGITVLNLTESDEIDRDRFGELMTGSNLFANESFEENPLSLEFPWRVDERGTDLTATWTDEYAASGEFALQFSASQGGNQGWSGIFRDEELVDGYDYELSADMFSPDGASGWLSFELYNEEGDYVIGYSTGCGTSVGDWHNLTLSLSAEHIQEYEASTVRIGVQQCLNHSEGDLTTLFVDNVSLVAEKE